MDCELCMYSELGMDSELLGMEEAREPPNGFLIFELEEFWREPSLKTR